MANSFTIPRSVAIRSGGRTHHVQAGHEYVIVEDKGEEYVNPHLREVSRELADKYFNVGVASKPRRSRKKADEPEAVEGDGEPTVTEEQDNGME